MKWLKTYRPEICDRYFRVILSENGGFHASCLWHESGRMIKAPGESVRTCILLDHRSDTTAELALEAIKKWAEENFDTDGAITEI